MSFAHLQTRLPEPHGSSGLNPTKSNQAYWADSRQNPSHNGDHLWEAC